MDSGKLTAKQERFVEEYLVDLNASAAYLRAGYKAKKGNSSEVGACNLLRNAKVQAAIQEARQKLSERAAVRQEDVIRELARVAFSCVSNYTQNGDELLVKDDAPPDAMQAVSSYEITEITNETKQGSFTTKKFKVRLWNKVEALSKLGQHLGLFIDRVAPVNPDGTPYDATGAAKDAQDTIGLIADLRIELGRLQRLAQPAAGTNGTTH